MTAKTKKKPQEWETERDDYLENSKGPMFFGLKLDEYQQEFRDTILDDENIITFCDSAAGNGKSLIAAGCAEMLVRSRKYDGIIYITAPVQESKMGFLPGTVEEKTDIYSEPFIIVLEKLGINPYQAVRHKDDDMKYGTAYIECRPHNYLRGLTFEHKVIIIDEAANFTTSELKKILTRACDNCKVIVIGSTIQCDLDSKVQNGFSIYLSAAHEDSEKRPWMKICTLVNNYRGELSKWSDQVEKAKYVKE